MCLKCPQKPITESDFHILTYWRVFQREWRDSTLLPVGKQRVAFSASPQLYKKTLNMGFVQKQSGCLLFIILQGTVACCPELQQKADEN